MKKLLFTSATALLAASVLVGPAFAQREYKIMALKGKQMPAFTLTALDGTKMTNQSLRGKVVVMDFWATWCGPCKAAAPKVQKMHDEWKNKGVVVLGMNTWERNDKEGKNAAAYVKEHNYTYTQTINNDELAKTLQVEGVPTFIVMDKTGKVVEITVGFQEAVIRAAVDKLIK